MNVKHNFEKVNMFALTVKIILFRTTMFTKSRQSETPTWWCRVFRNPTENFTRGKLRGCPSRSWTRSASFVSVIVLAINSGLESDFILDPAWPELWGLRCQGYIFLNLPFIFLFPFTKSLKSLIYKICFLENF